ncbi:type I polyketide synthase, partial [Streptomyces coeruleorubidus]|uniref:type I polyketide synthase n=1 Tax=Streptomyces coeruleorubidus TaxID=116188 RepID=UPI00378E75F7
NTHHHPTTYLEISPHPTLTPATTETLTTNTTTAPPAVITTLHRDHDDTTQLLTALTHTHNHGHPITWHHPTNTNTNTSTSTSTSSSSSAGSVAAGVPTYPFQRRHYWLPTQSDEHSEHNSRSTAPGPDGPAHPLLGATLDLPQTGASWFANTLKPDRPGFLEQHQLLGTTVVPATALLEWALAAARHSADGPAPAWILEGVTFSEPLHFADAPAIDIQANVDTAPDHDGSDSGDGYRIRCFGRASAQRSERWAQHITVALARPHADPRAVTSVMRADSAVGVLSGDGLDSPAAEEQAQALYERFEHFGVDYGARFRGLKRLLRHGDDGIALIEVDGGGAVGTNTDATGPGTERGSEYWLDPAVLDSCFHIAAAFVESDDVLWMPAKLDRIGVYGPLPARVTCRARWQGAMDDGTCALDLHISSDSGEVLVEVSGLRLRGVSRAALRSLGGRPARYEVGWRPFGQRHVVAGRSAGVAVGAGPDARSTGDEAGAVGGPVRERGQWLVFAYDAVRANEWREALGRLGFASVALVPAVPGDMDDSARTSADAVVVDPYSEADVARVLGDVRARAGGVVAGLVLDESSGRFAGHGAGRVPEPGPEGETDAVYALARRSFTVLKQVLREHAADLPEVVVCSAGATVCEGTMPLLSQAVPTAAVLAVVSEYPDIKCVQVDLDAAASPPPARQVLEAVAALDGSGHLALRGDHWYEARLRQAALSGAGDGSSASHGVHVVHADATYLVTGGMGGLGLATASWLADRGARSLVLVGRRVPTQEPAEVARLRADGVRVVLRGVDVADARSVEEVLGFIDRELPPLRGVVHAAGTTADVPLEELDWARFEQVLEPKVRGAWNLHRLTAETELDFFVLYSSLASLIGSAGQASYITANAFLDSLAAYRRALGLSAVSVNWGPWAEVGMAARRDLLGHLSSLGADAMSPERALEALSRLPGTAAAQVGVARLDWRRRLTALGGTRPYTLLSDLVPADLPGLSGLDPADAGRLDKLALLVLSDPDAAREDVLDGLLGRVALVLEMSAGTRDGLRPRFADQRLTGLGLDSLSTIRLRNRIQADFGVNVPAQQLLGGATAGELAELICQQLIVRNMLADADDDFADESGTEVLTL